MQIVDRALARTLKNVRIVGEGVNELIPVMEALARAEEEGLDLVVVNDKSDPIVVKIEDFKKLEYEKKKARSKQAKGADLKEIQLKVNITDHDLGTKVTAIEKFLKRGDKVKIIVRLKGRERETPERARELLEKILSRIPGKVSKTAPSTNSMVIIEPSKD